MTMKIALLTFARFWGKAEIGSSRIRCTSLLPYWPEAEEFKIGQKYDAVVYQKAYWLEHMRVFKGVKILDICDPDWNDFRQRVVQCINECDVVTTSNDELTKEIQGFTTKPVITVPDRMDPYFSKGLMKKHEGPARKVLWFGYSTNSVMLDGAISHVAKLGLDLIVISDKPYTLPTGYANRVKVTNYSYSDETFAEDAIKADFAINPQSKKGKWRFKSNNKTLQAWALGLPVAEDPEHMKALIDPAERQREADKRFQEIQEKWLVPESVEEMKKIIKVVAEHKARNAHAA